MTDRTPEPKQTAVSLRHMTYLFGAVVAVISRERQPGARSFGRPAGERGELSAMVARVPIVRRMLA
jgi:hypothetical protein